MSSSAIDRNDHRLGRWRSAWQSSRHAPSDFNMRYHTVGRQITDQTTVGLVFYPKGYVPKHVMNTMIAQTRDIDIPAGADNVRTGVYYKMEKPARLTGKSIPYAQSREGAVYGGDLPEYDGRGT